MPETFLAILEEAAEASLPATPEAMDNVAAKLDGMRRDWDARAVQLTATELAELRQRLGKLSALIDHAARRRLGLARHLQAMESGYTANGLPPRPAASSWECTG